MPWIDVDPQRLRDAAAQLKPTADEVQAVADYARESDPDWWTWGLGGLPFAGLYFGVSELVFHPCLEDAKAGIEGLCARLEECADAHQDADDGIAADLARIAAELGR
ncbi:type VII secretion target [Glycomyces terrestris]|uniref:Excreted virulence factor EspC (Type VII ESX diderm) n=1 Tax=Glycomyces terrestris TaxID=2493553 RepID=A0A426UY08_9ACTN|nr:type VII secretion target [Glycomyces terrestris]RRR99454.1 hypothetical protein EIW28_12155 [Glycomyces terrestris]